jgi:hypothetical protein
VVPAHAQVWCCCSPTPNHTARVRATVGLHPQRDDYDGKHRWPQAKARRRSRRRSIERSPRMIARKTGQRYTGVQAAALNRWKSEG